MTIRCLLGRFAAACLLSALASSPTFGEVKVLGTYYRPDQPSPQYVQFWHEGSNMPDQEEAAVREAAASEKYGSSLHVFLQNEGGPLLEIRDVRLAGISLNEALAFSKQRKRKDFASVYFAKLPPATLDKLLQAGEPVWWKADPVKVDAGGIAEIVVRLRQQPRSGSVKLTVVGANDALEAPVTITTKPPRFASISFSPDLRQIYAYLRHPDGGDVLPSHIAFDGKDVTGQATIAGDRGMDVAPVVITLRKPPTAMSLHALEASYPDKSIARASARAWADDFAYGIFGGLPGKSDAEMTVGRRYIDDLAAHNINLQMPQIGSGAVQDFFKSPQGKAYLKSRGIEFMLPDVGKFGINDPYGLWIHDEPDCGDFRAEGLPGNKKVGAMGQWLIAHSNELRAGDPDAMQMLNVDMTFKPHNWYNYGQLPDIFAIDPYYQSRLRAAYWDHPERIKLYTKATYIYACSDMARSASEPKPLHIILNSVATIDKKKNRRFRCATPPEKRIEVYYALAAGAKSLSYWWYTPGAPAYGVGAATSAGNADAAALWREIGLLGAEVRTAGPLLTTGCPCTLAAEAPRSLWPRFIVAGQDTLVLLVMNEQYANDDKGTQITPVERATVAFALPKWIDAPQVFEIAAAGTRDLSARRSGSNLTIPLDRVEAARMIVITADAGLRARLQNLYARTLAANTKALLK